MKYIVLLGDGMADYPIEKLGGKTPLAVARIPNMDRIAGEGTIGLVETIPAGFKPGSDVANLSVLGYDPGICYSGRGPLEAANMGVQIGPDDVAFRCNLVTLGPEADPVMVDYSAGHISSGEAARIVLIWTKPSGRRNSSFIRASAIVICWSGAKAWTPWRRRRPMTSREGRRPPIESTGMAPTASPSSCVSRRSF
jgi:2,3-bisphosphoglycerate-independent phosphoglycerate mutase